MMSIDVNAVLNKPIYSEDMTRFVRRVAITDAGVTVIACSASDYPAGGDSDRRYCVNVGTGDVGPELLTHAQAHALAMEALKQVAQQFINKDGMTGGRCVELARETLDRIKKGR